MIGGIVKKYWYVIVGVIGTLVSIIYKLILTKQRDDARQERDTKEREANTFKKKYEVKEETEQARSRVRQENKENELEKHKERKSGPPSGNVGDRLRNKS